MVFTQDSLRVDDFLIDKAGLFFCFEKLFLQVINFLFIMLFFSHAFQLRVSFLLDGFKGEFLFFEFLNFFLQFLQLILFLHKVSGIVDILKLPFKGEYFVFKLEDFELLLLNFLFFLLEEGLILLELFFLDLQKLFFALFVFGYKLLELIGELMDLELELDILLYDFLSLLVFLCRVYIYKFISIKLDVLQPGGFLIDL